jgi:hypothetical protein
MKSIGDVYLDASFFNDKASKTIGKPAAGPDTIKIIKNRREAKGKLTTKGQIQLNKILDEIKRILKTDEVKAVWDKFCGCSMCPCSPGYRIKINRDVKSLEKYRFSLWVDKKGYYEFNRPDYDFEIGRDHVDEMEKTFKK